MSTRKLLFPVAAAAALVGAVCISAGAQEFTSKEPTAADWAALARLPDFTGVWERGAAPRRNTEGERGPAARGRGAPRGAPAGARRGTRGNAGARRGRGRGGMQLTPEYEAKRAAYQAHAPEDNSTANCLPPGMPGIMTQPYPMEFLLTPGKVTIIIEAYTEVRHIYTDGRPFPEDPNPKFFGSSIGHWEGDTLVVETIGFSPQTTLAAGVPHSDKMRIVERFHLDDPDTMTIETTITDPVVLAAPYTTTSTLRRHRDWTISEYICEQNNRNSVDESGKASIDLTIPDSDSTR